MILELRVEPSTSRSAVFSIVSQDQPLSANVSLQYSNRERCLEAATGEVTNLATLQKAIFQLPPSQARELKVWIHQITPEGDSHGLPASVAVHMGEEIKQYELKLPDGQLIIPVSGQACRLEITLPRLKQSQRIET